MRKPMPYMVLDITKKPGDPNAVQTGDMLLAENEKLRKALVERESMLKRCTAFLGGTIQCGVEGEMLDGRHVNVAASDLADEIDDMLKKGGAK